MFKGNYKYSVDAKGRVSIPARLRKHVSPDANDTFVMTQGASTCIEVYPLDVWSKIEEKLSALNPYDPEQSQFTRITLFHAIEDTLDSQSRILIPQSLLEYAKIEKEVLILGVLQKIELWNPDVYYEYAKLGNANYGQLAAKVMAS